MVRCVSGCKGFSEEMCVKSPRCTYLNGKKKYCRLSHTFKMSKTNCKVSRRMTNKNKVDVARERLQQFFLKVKKPTVFHSAKTSASFHSANPSPPIPSPPSPNQDSLSAELTTLMEEPRLRLKKRPHVKKHSRAKTQKRAEMMYRGL